MKRISTRIGLLIIILLKASNSAAGFLCDSNCLLSITFPSSGSIEAVEPVTITFGAGGLIDTSGSVTAYLAGETLNLNQGQSIAFGGGGTLDIGTGGNITFTDLKIATEGEVLISAVGGQEQVQILAGDKLTLSGGGAIEVRPSIRIEGSLEIGPGNIMNIVGPGAPAGCEISSSSGASLSAQLGNPFTIGNLSTCNEIHTQMVNASLSGSGSILVVDTGTNTSFGALNLIGNNLGITASPLSLNETEENSNAGATSIFFFLLIGVIWACLVFRKYFLTHNKPCSRTRQSRDADSRR